LLSKDLAMAPTLKTPLIDRMAEWLGRRLARYLTQPIKGFVPLTTADPKAFLRALRPADVVLVEGDTRVAIAIKYLTQSTWSHSLIYVGPIPGRSEPSGEPHVLVEADVEHGVLSAPASKSDGGATYRSGIERRQHRLRCLRQPRDERRYAINPSDRNVPRLSDQPNRSEPLASWR
jgi:hypothetical protein